MNMSSFLDQLRRASTTPLPGKPLDLNKSALDVQARHQGAVMTKRRMDWGEMTIAGRKVRCWGDMEQGGIAFGNRTVRVEDVPDSMLHSLWSATAKLDAAIDADQVAMARAEIERALTSIATHGYVFAEIKMPSGKGKDTEATRKPSRASNVNVNGSQPQRGGMFSTNVESTGRRS
jgi:hypothetical protein